MTTESVAKLVKALRKGHKVAKCPEGLDVLMHEAADTIEEQQIIIDTLSRERKTHK